MSNDLISREAVLGLINGMVENGSGVMWGDKTLLNSHALLEKVSKLPTAYDVDKVVKNVLHIKTDNSCDGCKYKKECDELQDFYNPSEEVDLCGLTVKRLALDMIKAGGVNEQ